MTSPSDKTDNAGLGKSSDVLGLAGSLLRLLLLDAPLITLFVLASGVVVLHQVHDNYLYKQLSGMRFHLAERDIFETTYYHRICDDRDVSAHSVRELRLPPGATAKDASHHMLEHGATLYPNLLTESTASELREFIVKENYQRTDVFEVIENEHRYSWGIDINMHPALKTFWKELASNEALVGALEEICGPDPAVIEFTAITSAFGAVDQFDHPDLVTSASGTKYAHSFIPSYSLFIPLQNTSYDMGATHVCPGTHLCSDGFEDFCPRNNVALSGEDDNWPMGWGALVNQQTIHKGTKHSKEGGPDRVVIIATFAPRPTTPQQLETRMLGQGTSYSMHWAQWGHTFSDFVMADTRMNEPQKTLRSLGLIKGRGWNYVSVTSMRIANDETGYEETDDLILLLENGGLSFLPRAWQGQLEGDSTGIIHNLWYSYLHGTLIRTETGLKEIYCLFLVTYLCFMFLADLLYPKSRNSSNGSFFIRSLWRALLSHIVVVLAWFLVYSSLSQTMWAKDISTRKMFHLPTLPNVQPKGVMVSVNATRPVELDILQAPDYSARHFAGYGEVIKYAHPGNAIWRALLAVYAKYYPSLSDPLQQELCETALDFAQQRCRFLYQDVDREWRQIKEEDDLLDICHGDMVKATSPLTNELIREVESLKTIAKYGRFRVSDMTKHAISHLLDDWEKRLMPKRSDNVSPDFLNIEPIPSTNLRVFPSVHPKTIKTVAPLARATRLPSSNEPKEPHDLAWVTVGSIIEAKPKCEGSQWIPARLTRIYPGLSDVDVEYSENTFDTLPWSRKCLRAFEFYEVGDVVALEDDGGWTTGVILSIDTDEMLADVETDDFVLEDVSVGDFSRFDEEETFSVEEIVLAQFENYVEYSAATVTAVNADGTYSLKFHEDGAEVSGISSFDIRRLVDEEEDD
eukprot:Nitzschia sp. Nitz4//scaffold21_size171442//47219//50125//NITZ4_002153-RA/size171442-processed-gene-0.112-mRNA-1//1//CDS//3329542387//1997//frame0